MTGFDSVAAFLGGLGLFFTGIRSLSANMLQIGGRPLRQAIAGDVHNPLLVAIVGIAAGALLQSSNGITFILVSMNTAGLLGIGTAMPLLLWANLGTSVLVAVAAVDLRLVTLLALGIAGIWLYIDRTAGTARRQVMEVVLAIAMVFLGLEMLRAGTGGLRASGTASEAIALAGASGVGAFLLGCVVTLFTQSSSATTILAVSAAQAGLLPFEGAVMLVLGASIGAGISVVLMGGSTRGSQRQLVLFQGLTKLLGVAVILPLVIVEDATNLPLLLRVVRMAAADPGQQLALIYLACQVAALAAYALPALHIRRLVAALAPPLEVENLARPRFIYEAAVGDADIALILAEKEQARLTARLAPALEEADEVAAASIIRLRGDIGTFLTSIASSAEGAPAALSRAVLDRLANLQARNEVLRALFETVHQIARTRGGLPRGPAADLADALSQGLGAVLMCVDDAARSSAADDIALLKQLSSDRSSVVDALRRRLIQAENQDVVYNLTSLFERAVWLVQRYALLLGAGVGEGN
jgi:phosphate:Na+ symporter